MWRRWSRYQNEINHERQRGSARPRITTPGEEDADSLPPVFMEGTVWWLRKGRRTSLRTVYRRAIQLRLRSRRSVMKIPVGPVHHQIRLNRCRARQNGGIQEWGKIGFSDQTRFYFNFNNGRMRVLRRFWRHAFWSMSIMVEAASWYGEPLASTANGSDLNLWPGVALRTKDKRFEQSGVDGGKRKSKLA